MSSISPSEFAKDHGILGFLHFLVFPLDIFISGDGDFEAGREQRVCELTPILFWLIPLIIILTNFTYLSGLGLALFLLLEIFLLVFLSIIYCWRLSIGFLFELFINYFLSFLILGILMMVLTFIWASCGLIIIVIFVVGVISYFSRGNSDRDYYDDDW
ncbi:MAG: hypothetical protein AB1782_14625 [Cyanobacteriota bacterium]